ncbi:MAG TPA: hypothetical protein VLJ80_01030 [Solirubrobacteraceae bacterium]|nr:hypothetical protein [Solirubrobacteraceae bacterium]
MRATGVASESAISVEMLGARPRAAARTIASTWVGERVIVIAAGARSGMWSLSHIQTIVCIGVSQSIVCIDLDPAPTHAHTRWVDSLQH